MGINFLPFNHTVSKVRHFGHWHRNSFSLAIPSYYSQKSEDKERCRYSSKAAQPPIDIKEGSVLEVVAFFDFVDKKADKEKDAKNRLSIEKKGIAHSHRDMN